MAQQTSSGRTDNDLVTSWRDITSCYSSVRCALDRELEEQHGLGMSEFEALDRLAEAPDGSQRMQELGTAMYLSQSALSRVVARLERDGLVRRDMCAQDRRGVFVKLTEAGRDRHNAARPTQLAVLADHIGGRC
ncbi:MAG TPA: MarR family transcriptional regulator [Micromonosporaceae bacterium]|jgi:DNA-binding MarR family transcriptional regulator